MDPLTSLGLAAAIVQFVDIGTRVTATMVTLYQDNDTSNLEDILRDDLVRLQSFKSLFSARSKSSPSGDIDKAIFDILDKCSNVLDLLQEKVDRVVNLWKRHRSRGKAFASFMASLGAVWSLRGVETARDRLRSIQAGIVPYLLLALDNKADSQLSEIISGNGEVVEILATLRQKSAAESQEIVGRIHDTSNLTLHLHEEVMKAIVTLKDGQKTIQRAIESDPHTSAESPASRLLLVNLRSSRGETDARVLSLEQIHRTIVSNLYFRQITDRIDIVKDSHKETFQWIFRNPAQAGKHWDDFAAWLEGEKGGCYWICGKAGSGKSTLMKYICHATQTRSALSSWARNGFTSAKYFFWGFGANALQKSQEGLIRSILHDVLSGSPHLMVPVMPELVQLASTLAPGERLDTPSLAELRRWFQRLLRLKDGSRFFILIDGIDEYEGDAAIIVNLLSECGSQDHIKVVASSRPIPPCMEGFRHFPQLQLHELTRRDIQLYVEGKLHPQLEYRGYSSDLFLDQIIEKASGVFLWVEVVVQLLLRGLENCDTLGELRGLLDDVPPDLSDLYWHMLEQLSPAYQQQAARYLLSVLEGNRIQNFPMTLIQISFLDDGPILGPLEAKPAISKEQELRLSEHMEGRLRSRCCGLLESRQAHSSEEIMLAAFWYPRACVDFLHRTVVEFFCQPTANERIRTLAGGDFHVVESLLNCSLRAAATGLASGYSCYDKDARFNWQMVKCATVYDHIQRRGNWSAWRLDQPSRDALSQLVDLFKMQQAAIESGHLKIQRDRLPGTFVTGNYRGSELEATM